MHCDNCKTDTRLVKSYKCVQFDVTKRVGGKDVPTGDTVGSGMMYWYECDCGQAIKASGVEL